MEHALHLLILILATRLLGELFERIGRPASIGEILAGDMPAMPPGGMGGMGGMGF